jgi:hypothetical protein
MNKNKKNGKSTELVGPATPAKALRGSPFGNLLSEDATAAREHGRMTARVGVDPAGNPVVYSTDVHTREAVVSAIERRTNVGYCDVPEVTAVQFDKLLREGGRALVQPHGLVDADVSEGQLDRDPSPSVQAAQNAPFVLRIREGRRIVDEAGPFEKITAALETMRERGERGQVATIYDGSRVADYRGGRAVFSFGRTKWSRADG